MQLDQLSEWLAPGPILTIAGALLLGVIGGVAARVLGAVAERLMRGRANPQYTMIVGRAVRYTLLGIAGATALEHLGFDLTVLLGAAGILTVAVGFASQTSMSNLVSGMFLLGERPFVLGDVVRAGTTTGEVVAIDALSVKLRTFDNLLVRIPNETLLKSEITNFTAFPIRRFDLLLRVGLSEDLEPIRRLLFDVAERHPVCLTEPAPLLIFMGFSESGTELQFSVWGATHRYLELRNGIAAEVRSALVGAGVDVPAPRRRVEIISPPPDAPTPA